MVRIACMIFLAGFLFTEILVPVNTQDRKSTRSLKLSNIGSFGLLRKARPGVPAHFHTGIDIRRPSQNYMNEPVYPIAEGTIISKRDDGPYAQLIIEHESPMKFWTVYEHVAGIHVDLNDRVMPGQPIARFMNKPELDKYGWQFDHFHFEVLKVKPMRLADNPGHGGDRKYCSYSLVCYTEAQLNKYFYNPLEFLQKQMFNNSITRNEAHGQKHNQ